MASRVQATVVNGHTFTISDRYNLNGSKILGRGSFGVVATALDIKTNNMIAIKRIRPFANDDWDARHTLREVRLLRLLGPHPNVISLYGLSLYEDKTELYMVMELMDCDLHRVISSKQGLTPKHHKCFVRQIVEGIKAMHAVGVFHRDLKPGNILVSKDCQLRITDFGLARYMDECTRQGKNSLNPMTEYVVTRWYRCPELLLCPNRPYSEAIDLWSIGCILAELFRRKPLFPGKSHANQVQIMFEGLGLESIDNLGFKVSSEATSFLEKRCHYPKQKMQTLVPEATDEAVELLEALLSLNPNKRPSAASALEFDFLKDADVLCDYSKNYLRRPTKEYFDFESEKYSLDELRDLIHLEVNTPFETEADVPDADIEELNLNSSPNTLLNRRKIKEQETERNEKVIASQTRAQTQINENSGTNKASRLSAGAIMAKNREASRDDDDGPASQMHTFISRHGGLNGAGGGQRGQENFNLGGNKLRSDSITGSNPIYEESEDLARKEGFARFASRDSIESAGAAGISNDAVPMGRVLSSVRNLNANSPHPSNPKSPSPSQKNKVLVKDAKTKQRISGNAQQQPQQQQQGNKSVNPYRSTGNSSSVPVNDFNPNEFRANSYLTGSASDKKGPSAQLIQNRPLIPRNLEPIPGEQGQVQSLGIAGYQSQQPSLANPYNYNPQKLPSLPLAHPRGGALAPAQISADTKAPKVKKLGDLSSILSGFGRYRSLSARDGNSSDSAVGSSSSEMPQAVAARKANTAPENAARAIHGGDKTTGDTNNPSRDSSAGKSNPSASNYGIPGWKR